LACWLGLFRRAADLPDVPLDNFSLRLIGFSESRHIRWKMSRLSPVFLPLYSTVFQSLDTNNPGDRSSA
jgi:hypothetical protein